MTDPRPNPWELPTNKDCQLDQAGALAWMARLMGPVHRLAWHGRDREGDRERCQQHLGTIVGRAYGLDGPARTAAVLVDWWMQAALGGGVLGVSWHLGDHLAAHPALLQALDEVISHQGDEPALRQLRRPTLFLRAQRHLRELVERTVKFKKSPGPEIYAEARAEAWELVHIAESAGARPPGRLRLLDRNVEDWASELRGGREALQRRLKVWNALVKRLYELQSAARDVVTHWSTDSPQDAPLPGDWRSWLDEELHPCAALAEAVLWDVASVAPAFDEPPPPCLRAEWLLDELKRVSPDLDPASKVLLLALAREAVEYSPSHPAPGWVADAEDHLASLRTRIRTLRVQAESLHIEEAGQQLAEALAMLDRLDVSESAGWIDYAEETIEQQAQDAAGARLERETAAWLAELEEVGGALPETPEEERIEQRHARTEQAWNDVRAQLVGRRDAVAEAVSRLAACPTRAQSEPKLAAATESIEQGRLGAARRLLDGVEDLLLAERRAMDERLRPELREIKARAEEAEFRDREIESLRTVLHRIEARAEAEFEHRPMIEALEGLISTVERREGESLAFLGVGVGVGDGGSGFRIRITRWLASGVEVDPLRFGSSDLELPLKFGRDLKTGDLVAVGGSPGWFRREGGSCRVLGEPVLLPEARWYDVVPVTTLERPSEDEIRRHPFRANLSEEYFIAASGWIQGPYRRSEEALVPSDSRGFVARMDADHFAELFGLVEIGGLAPRGSGSRRLVHLCPTLEDLLGEEAEPVDRLDPGAVEAWLAELTKELEGVDAGDLAHAITRLEMRSAELPQAVLEHRLRLLREFLETSRLFQEERRRAAEWFVETEEGKREVQRAASRRVDEMLETVRRQVEVRGRKLEAEIEASEQVLDERRRQLTDLEGAELHRREELGRQTRDLQEEIDALQELRKDTKTRLLAEILHHPSSSPPVEPMGEDPGDPAGPLRAPACAVQPVADLTGLATELARRLPTWGGQEVANLLASLVASPWTLMAGPPGVGKSTLARAFLSQLGHGPRTGRCLELVVRRDWQDDSPLFGFWHPSKRAWEPSSEGFVELLLTARDDHEGGHGGLYTALFEEMNLASPEYYLSRPISAIEASDPQVRLYGDELRPRNQGRYPATFALPPNVRLVGTVNIDDTVERLSPRFLSRVSVIWMEPVLETFTKPLEISEPPEIPFDWRDLLSLAEDRPAPALEPVMKAIVFLHENRFSGAPSPRTVRGIERYLAIAQDLLPERVAEDYQVLQRILPSIRGVGERYRSLMDELASLCSRQGWRMSAQRCERIRSRGEELGDFYDFFHA